MNNFESNENLFKKIFFEHSAIMLLIEPETGKILRSNKAAQNFYGYSIEQLSEMKIQEINLLSPQEVEKERMLAVQEKRNHFIFPHKLANEGNNDGLWDWNTVTNEVFYSKRWKEMIGYEENEILNDISEWEKRVHPEDLELVYERLNKHLKGENHFYRSEHRLKSKDGSYKWILDRGKVVSWTEDKKPLRVVGTHTDITIQKETEIENKRLLKELKEALGKVKTLSGFLPICAKCKKIRDDEGYWNQIENYIREHSDAKFSHGICPECAKVLYPEIYKKI